MESILNDNELSHSYIPDDIITLEPKLLSIGLCTIDSRQESYLERCVDSIIQDALRSGYLSDMRIKILDCDITTYEARPIVQIKIKYGHLFEDDTLLFEKVNVLEYPSFDNLPRHFDDSDERVRWRSKQCFDVGLLFEKCYGLGQYHLHMEDDVIVEPGFFERMFSTVYSYRETNWCTMVFGKSGFIGHLFHGEDILKVGNLCKTFYDEMPVDWLINAFHRIKGMSGGRVVTHRDGLLTHIGEFSTLGGQIREQDIYG